MKNYACLFAFFCLLLAACGISKNERAVLEKMSPLDRKQASMDYFHTMRSFPEATYDQNAIFEAIKADQVKPRTKAFEGSWTQQGPSNIGGRINSLAISPENSLTMFIGLSYGGIYKTDNGGISWTSVFDGQVDQSISEVTIDPNNSNNIWVGTGDKSVPFTAFTGSGIYNSSDGGNNWQQRGLNGTGIIGKILIDPNDSNNIYAAALGSPIVRDNNRGLYKSVDGGNTWAQSLFINDSTGVLDVHMSSTNPNVLYANSWTRLRTNRESVINSTENKIFKSVDGGDSWTQLSNGLPEGVFAKVNLTVAPQNPNRLYAAYVDTEFDLHAIYTSADGGDTWMEYFSDVPYSNFGWYFDQLVVAPDDENDLYFLAVSTYKINNGIGVSLVQGSYHSDCHELLFQEPNQALLATDGGLFKTTSLSSGGSWTKIDDVPITQYYHVVHKPNEPSIYVGGAQDNSMNEGSAAAPSSWDRFAFGDGFQPRYLHTREEFFSESQFGNVHFHANNQLASTGNLSGRVSEITNWDTPYVVDENLIMHIGAQSVYRVNWNDALSGGEIETELLNYEQISPRLTDPDEPYHGSAHVITTIDKMGNNILAGTGDGRLWLTNDDGADWARLDQNGLPKRFIKSARFSSDDPNRLFVCHSGYKDNDSTPHIFYSSNSGQNWSSINGDLPNVGINDLELIPGTNDHSIVIGTDIGVYGTTDQGENWSRIGDNLSYTPVFDVHYNGQLEEVAAATFGNSILTFPADEFLSPFVGIENDIANTLIQITPNPSTGPLRIKSSKEVELSVHAVNGQVVYRKTIAAGDQILRLDDLSSGIYLVRASQNGQQVFAQKWLIK